MAYRKVMKEKYGLQKSFKVDKKNAKQMFLIASINSFMKYKRKPDPKLNLKLHKANLINLLMIGAVKIF